MLVCVLVFGCAVNHSKSLCYMNKCCCCCTTLHTRGTRRAHIVSSVCASLSCFKLRINKFDMLCGRQMMRAFACAEYPLEGATWRMLVLFHAHTLLGS